MHANELARDIDQLWAEAVLAFKAGAKWWPERGEDDDFIAAQERVTEGRMKKDIWYDEFVSKLLEWRDKGHDISKLYGATHMAGAVLSLNAKDANQSVLTRINGIMISLGYTAGAVYLGGKTVRGYKLNGELKLHNDDG